MNNKAWQNLTQGPLKAADIDDLEALARAHEAAAYRYRSAISLLRQRIQAEDHPKSDAANGHGPDRSAAGSTRDSIV